MKVSERQPDGVRGVAPAWHTLDTGAVLGRLQSHAEQGLSDEEAGRRLEQHGHNVLQGQSRRGWPLMLARQFSSCCSPPP